MRGLSQRSPVAWWSSASDETAVPCGRICLAARRLFSCDALGLQLGVGEGAEWFRDVNGLDGGEIPAPVTNGAASNRPSRLRQASRRGDCWHKSVAASPPLE